MRTDIPAGLTAVLPGGQIYWLIIISPNATDTWSAIALGNLAVYSLAGYTVWTSRLTEIGGFDQSVDMFDNPIAKVPQMDFTILNLDAAIDPRLYMGRRVQLRMGYGTTMSIATSHPMATVTIMSVVPENHKVVFQCSGRTGLWDKEIGTKVPETADSRSKGKIYPIVHGDWTDRSAMLPVILTRDAIDIPDLVADTRAWDTLGTVMLYDSSNRRALTLWNALSTNWWFATNTDKNKVYYFNSGTGKTLTKGIGPTYSDSLLKISSAFSGLSNGDSIYLRLINSSCDEIVKVTMGDWIASTSLYVERACKGTKLGTFNIGDPVYLIGTEASEGRMKCAITMAPIDITVTKLISYLGGYVTTMQDTGRAEYINNSYPPFSAIGKQLNQYLMVVDFASSELNTGYALVFPKLGIEGDITALYLLIKATVLSSQEVVFTATSHIYGAIAKTSAPTTKVLFTSQISGNAAEAVDTITDPADWDSIDISSLGVTAVADLNEKPLTILLHADAGAGTAGRGKAELLIEQLKIYFAFTLDPVKNDFYVNGKGRKNPGGRFNGSAGDLIENPSSVIEDVLVTAVPGMTAADLDEASFDALYTARSNWKLASLIYSGK